jgi:hypothetical protein
MASNSARTLSWFFWISVSVTPTHCLPVLPWHIVAQRYPDTLFPSVTLTHCCPVLPWHIIFQRYPDTLLLSVTLRHCFPALPWHLVSQRYLDTLFPNVTLTHCFPALPWHIVSHLYPDTLFASVTLTHCCLALPWHIVSQLYPDTLFPNITLTFFRALPWHIIAQCYPDTLLPSVTLALCFQPGFYRTSSGVPREVVEWIQKKLNYHYRFQTFLQKSREILSGSWQCWVNPRALRTSFIFSLDQFAVQVVVSCEVPDLWVGVLGKWTIILGAEFKRLGIEPRLAAQDCLCCIYYYCCFKLQEIK